MFVDVNVTQQKQYNTMRFPLKECPGYDVRLHLVARVPVMELWGMWSTSSLPLLPGPALTRSGSTC